MDKNSTSTTNQPSHYDNQNFKIDIEKVYTSIIGEIDKIRSNVSVANNPQIKAFIQSFNTNSPSQKSILSQLSIDINNLQESRCHAFYRLMGLPVYEPAGTFYSPGINRASDKKGDFKKFKRLVAAGIRGDLFDLMDAREISVNNYLKIFAISDINASVLALSSSARLRKFSVIQDGTDPFNSSIPNQSYSIDNDLNASSTAHLKQYQDTNGNMVSGSALGFLTKRSHIIAPFMVDPRVELSVNPPYTGSSTSSNTAFCRIMGAPFAIDKSQLQYTENIYAERPIIETVCRKRLNTAQPESSLSDRFKNVMDYVKNTNFINDQVLLDKVYSNPTKSAEDQVFLQYVNIIRAMIDKLVEAITIIKDVESKYHWVPIPNTKGPEFGSTTQSIIIGDALNTTIDTDIINKIVQNEIAQINIQGTQVSQPDLGNFVDLEKLQAPTDNQTTDAVGDRSAEETTDMITKRTDKTNAANDALRTIEIIMGEFSGLGLCDILAIYLALWAIDTRTLVGMLDTESFIRLTQSGGDLQAAAVQERQANNNNPVSGYDIVTVMTNFEQKVIEIYKLMDQLLADRQNSGTTKS